MLNDIQIVLYTINQNTIQMNNSNYRFMKEKLYQSLIEYNLSNRFINYFAKESSF